MLNKNRKKTVKSRHGSRTNKNNRTKKTLKAKQSSKKALSMIPYMVIKNINSNSDSCSRSERGEIMNDPISNSCRQDDIDGFSGYGRGDSLLH